MKNKKCIVFLILMLAPLAGIGIDIYAPALPELRNVMHISVFAGGLTMTVYLLGYAVGLFIMGPLSDSLGRYKVLLFGLVLYVVASALIALSSQIVTLMIFRGLQGFAVAGPGVISKILVTDLFDSKKSPKVMASVTAAWGLGIVAAPCVGGYLTHHLGWASCFWFLVIYAIIATVLALFYLQETLVKPVPLRPATLLLNYGKVIKHMRFMSLCLSLSLYYAMFVIFNINGPFLIQQTFNKTAVFYGNIALLLGFVFFISASVNRKLLVYLSISKIVGIGIILLLAGSGLQLVFGMLQVHNLVVIILFVLISYVGIGLTFANTMITTVNLFPDNTGTANAVMNASFVLGAALISIVASLLPHQTQVPMGSCYLVIALLSLLIYLYNHRLEPQSCE